MKIIVCGHICEIQLHLQPVFALHGDGGREAYKWFRRFVAPLEGDGLDM